MLKWRYNTCSEIHAKLYSLYIFWIKYIFDIQIIRGTVFNITKSSNPNILISKGCLEFTWTWVMPEKNWPLLLFLRSVNPVHMRHWMQDSPGLYVFVACSSPNNLLSFSRHGQICLLPLDVHNDFCGRKLAFLNQSGPFVTLTTQ